VPKTFGPQISVYYNFFIAMFFFRRVCVQRFALLTDRPPAAVLKHFLSILKKKHGIDVRDEPDHSPHPRK